MKVFALPCYHKNTRSTHAQFLRNSVLGLKGFFGGPTLHTTLTAEMNSGPSDLIRSLLAHWEPLILRHRVYRVWKPFGVQGLLGLEIRASGVLESDVKAVALSHVG